MERHDGIRTAIGLLIGGAAGIAVAELTGRSVLQILLAAGPAIVIVAIGAASQSPLRYTLPLAVSLLAWQSFALLLLPLPLDYAAWAVGYLVLVLMMFSERANIGWSRLVDRLFRA